MYRVPDSDRTVPPHGAAALSPQVDLFPSTRFMGSKEKLLLPLWQAIGHGGASSVLDLCSGTGVVSYMLKAQGMVVASNDAMTMATTIARATVANATAQLSQSAVQAIVQSQVPTDDFIWRTYGDIYFGREDVAFLDRARIELHALSGAERAIATAALIRACIKRRPRGIFTYTGNRYDDGRKDLTLTLTEHFAAAVTQINAAVFDNGTICTVHDCDLAVALPDVTAEVVYLDPPYFSPLSDNEYVRRYHFPEALARDWQGVDIQQTTKTKKIRNYNNPFKTAAGCAAMIGQIVDRYRDSRIVISYGSNSLPDAAAIIALLQHHGRRTDLIEVDHRYSFANQAAAKQPVRNAVKELIFIAE